MADQFTLIQWDREEVAPAPQTPELGSVSEEVEDEPVSPASPAPAPVSTPASPTTATATYYIRTTVGDPQITQQPTHFILYLITTETNNPAFPLLHLLMRRRFLDFEFLYQCLVLDYPTLLVPPLPDKHNLTYLKGESSRFLDEFVARRQRALDIFLSRVLAHKVLSSSKAVVVFLLLKDWLVYKRNLTVTTDEPTAVDALTETLMNAFKKTEETNEDILAIHEKLNRLNDNLSRITKVFERIGAKSGQLGDNYAAFQQNLARIRAILVDGALTGDLEAFATGIDHVAHGLGQYAQFVDQQFTTSLALLVQLIVAFKRLLKLKQERKLDLELLTGYLADYRYEKNRLITSSGHATGARLYLMHKLDDLKGVNHEQARLLKLSKLDDKIATLEAEVALQEQLLEEFEATLLKEWTYFEQVTSKELKQSLLQLCDVNVEYYKGVVDKWREVEKRLDNEKLRGAAGPLLTSPLGVPPT